MDASLNCAGAYHADFVAPWFEDKERNIDLFAPKNVRYIAHLIQDGDGEQQGEDAVAEYGAFDGHRLIDPVQWE